MNRRVLLCTADHDAYCSPRVAAAIERAGGVPVVFDTTRYPSPSCTLHLSFPHGGSLCIDGTRYPLDAFGAMWFRRVDPRTPVDSTLAPAVITEANRTVRGMLDLFPGLVIDRPSVVHAAHKVHQLSRAAACGLHVPAAIQTSDPDEARAFVAAHPAGVISKMMHDVRLPDDAERTGPTVFTNTVGPEDVAALDDLAWCPMTFQARVHARLEVRVLAMGERVLGAALDNDGALDWRRTGAEDIARWSRWSVPDDLAAAILRLQSTLGLRQGAYDFVVDDDGRPWFLEVNPHGEWFWLDDVLNLGVADALAAALLAD